MNTLFKKFLLFLFVVIPLFNASSQASLLLQSINVSHDHFNPTAGQRVTISFAISKAGKVIVQVIDRDGYLVKTLWDGPLTSGTYQYEWLGNSDADPSKIVSDEAFSFRIQISSKDRVETYFPANQLAKALKTELKYYDRKRGIVSYVLEKAGRVHLQAGAARVDDIKKSVDGPVMKTITNRAPRGSGSVAEFWDGFADGDNSIYVPDLPNFKIAVAATELPENSVITVGNRTRSFAENIVNRKGTSFFTFKASSHHHQGLATLDDLSPAVSLQFENASWNQSDRIWEATDSTLKMNGKIEGINAEAFSKQEGRLLVFLNEKRIVDVPKPLSKVFSVTVPLKNTAAGIHILSINSVSLNGPVGVHTVRLRINKNLQSTQSKK